MNSRETLALFLPWPPSVNRYWRSVNGRAILSREGRAFRERALIAIRAQQNGGVPLTGRLAVLIDAMPPDRRRRDLDNISKGLLDALTAAGIWQDDSQIDLLTLRRQPCVPDGRIELRICAVETV